MAPAPTRARVLAGWVLTAVMFVAGAAPNGTAAATAAGAGAAAVEAADAPGPASSTPRATEPAPADGTAEDNDRVPGEDQKPAPGEQSPSAEVFVPSEEISEDFTVSFPVDI